MESPSVLRKVPGAFSSPVVTPRPRPGSRALRANLLGSPAARGKVNSDPLSVTAVFSFLWALLTLLAFGIYSILPLTGLEDLVRWILSFFFSTSDNDNVEQRHFEHTHKPHKHVDRTVAPPQFNFARFGFKGSRLDFAIARSASGLQASTPDIDPFTTPHNDEHKKHLLHEVLARAKANGLNEHRLEWIRTRFHIHYADYTVFDDKERDRLQQALEREAKSSSRTYFLGTKEEKEERQRILAQVNAEEAEDEGYQSQDSVCSKVSYFCDCSRPHVNTFSPSSELDTQIDACIAHRKAAEAAAAAAEAERIRHRRQLSDEKKEKKRLNDLKELEAKTIGRRVIHGKLVKFPSQKQQEQIDEARAKPEDTPLCRPAGGDTLYKHTFDKLLDPRGWLDDKAIMSYLNVVCDLVNERAERTKDKKATPKVMTIDSLVYARWRETYGLGEDLAKVPNGLRVGARVGNNRPKLFEVETILVPVNNNAHWTLLVISPKTKKFEYIDSFRSSGRVPITIARKVLAGFLGPAYKDKEWTDVQTVSPRQRNGYDCGVFVCTNGECIASGVSIDCYDEYDMTAQRSRIAAVLLNEGFVNGLTPALDM